MKIHIICLIAILFAATPALAELPDAVELLPDTVEDALLVCSVDVSAIGEVGGLDKIAKAYPLVLRQFKKDELIQKLDFDILTDLHSIAAALWLHEDKTASFVAVASGKFKADVITSVLKTELAGCTTAEIAGRTVIVLEKNVQHDGTHAILLHIADDSVMFMLATAEEAETAMRRLADANRQPSPAAKLLEPYEGMIRYAVNTKALPEEVWEAAAAIGIGPENLLALGASGSLRPVEHTGMDIEVKTVLDTPESARTVHLAAFGGIETAKQWMPVSQLFFDEMTLACKDTAVSVTMEGDMITVSQVSIMAAILLPALNRAREAAQRTACINNLKQVGAGLTLYKDGPGEQKFYPRSLKAVFDEEVLLDSRVFICPNDPNAPDDPNSHNSEAT